MNGTASLFNGISFYNSGVLSQPVGFFIQKGHQDMSPNIGGHRPACQEASGSVALMVHENGSQE